MRQISVPRYVVRRFSSSPKLNEDKFLEDAMGLPKMEVEKREKRKDDRRRAKYIFSRWECWPLIERSPEISFLRETPVQSSVKTYLLVTNRAIIAVAPRGT